MIYVRISDGLGNQLFQYTLARSVQLKFKTEVKLDHISGYKNTRSLKVLFYRNLENLPSKVYFERKVSLDKFNITIPTSNTQELLEFYFRNDIRKNTVRAWIKRISRLALMGRHLSYKDYMIILEQLSLSNELYENIMKRIEQNNLAKDIYLLGGWQVKHFAESVKDSIRQELTLKEENKSPEFYRIQTLMQESESVSVHVRQKLDYEKTVHPFHTVQYKLTLDYSYYLEAMEFIRKRIDRPLKFFIFCDDIEWAKKSFSSDERDIFFVTGRENLKDYEELMLMSLCKHNIIANSTFSWWGAWLNSYSNKISIAPSQVRWTVDPKRDMDVLFGENWIRL